ncbi:hypothetical protein P154DRAFT_617926 [Amniculicola lignicola CBS 123094]|uniref:RNase H type-1 domain-containing protein n=1 Tax=Amniculicola lignicola CBS 123094 TaxID=1392246 RepID=A0A6A5WN57_9PLEO|nr:hypothetical protein P154DRAFT_617926 [Amniculicola lignicola CBS 123094]
MASTNLPLDVTVGTPIVSGLSDNETDGPQGLKRPREEAATLPPAEQQSSEAGDRPHKLQKVGEDEDSVPSTLTKNGRMGQINLIDISARYRIPDEKCITDSAFGHYDPRTASPIRLGDYFDYEPYRYASSVPSFPGKIKTCGKREAYEEACRAHSPAHARPGKIVIFTDGSYHKPTAGGASPVFKVQKFVDGGDCGSRRRFPTMMLQHMIRSATSIAARGAVISLFRVPSHIGVPGNDLADKVANEARQRWS